MRIGATAALLVAGLVALIDLATPSRFPEGRKSRHADDPVGSQVRSRVTPPTSGPTPQRWKMALKVKGLSEPVRTRIEFSRGKSTAESVLGPVAKPIADSYGSSPFSASHYGLAESIAQKVSAMAGRDRTRDLFDLAMLLERYAKDVGSVTALHPPSEQARAALDRASEMTFDAYKAEVLPYLEKSKRKEHGSRQSWEEKKAIVVQALEIFRR